MSKIPYRTMFAFFWTSKEWRALPPGPAQALAMYLATGPAQYAVPGVLIVGEGALADQLRWPGKKVRQAMNQVVGAGAAQIDRAAGLIWLPWRYDHERPASPDVVRGWRTIFEQLPAGDLADRVKCELRERMKQLGPKFVTAFDSLPNVGEAPTLGGDPPPGPSPATLGGDQRSSEAEKQKDQKEEAEAAAAFLKSGLSGEDDWPPELMNLLRRRVHISEAAWVHLKKVTARFPLEQRIRAALEALDKPASKSIGCGLLLRMIESGDGDGRPIPSAYLPPVERRPAWKIAGFPTSEAWEAAAAARAAAVMNGTALSDEDAA